ncbi:hypothetical protein [Streptomyces sp. NBC_01451]|nr:hypothetical protein [Streptomyces sp. NBC_01451]
MIAGEQPLGVLSEPFVVPGMSADAHALPGTRDPGSGGRGP